MPDDRRDPHTDFDRWLDTEVSGTPEPAATSADIQHTASSGLEDAARQFHGLAARADRALQDTATTDRLDHVWEQIMDTTTSTPMIGTTHRDTADLADRMATPPWIATITASRWSTALNGALAAALVIALVAGFWRASDGIGLPGGSGEENGPIRFAAMTSQGEQTFEAEPVPTADECTVEPLTVDEVMDALERDPYHYVGEAHRNQDFVATPAVPATPVVDERFSNYPPVTGYVQIEREVIEDIAARHRVWIACSMTGDPFHLWALESDARLQQTIGSRYLSGYRLETVRAELQEAKDSGPAGTRFELPSYSDDTLIPMVLVQGGDALYPSVLSTVAEVSFYWTTIDGSIAGRPNYLTEAQFNDPAYAPLRDRYVMSNNTGVFIHYTSRGGWLLDDTRWGRG